MLADLHVAAEAPVEAAAVTPPATAVPAMVDAPASPHPIPIHQRFLRLRALAHSLRGEPMPTNRPPPGAMAGPMTAPPRPLMVSGPTVVARNAVLSQPAPGAADAPKPGQILSIQRLPNGGPGAAATQQPVMFNGQPQRPGQVLSIRKLPEITTGKPIQIGPEGVQVQLQPASRLDADAGPLRLFVVQPTGFCNLACTYCYLPEKDIKTRMDPDLYAQALASILDSGYVDRGFTIVWHAGEPLAAGRQFFRKAFELTDKINRGRYELVHSIQTNGLMIDDQWCALFKEFNVRIGLSIDGPSFIHDKYRVTRQGKPTLEKALKGVEALRRNGIEFSVIAVLTSLALDHPDAIYEFFQSIGVKHLGFNVEEIEGANTGSSLVADQVVEKYRKFMDRYFDLARDTMRVREFDNMVKRLLQGNAYTDAKIKQRDVIWPYTIVSMAIDGSFSTFSPELLGLTHNGKNYTLGKFPEDSLQSIRYSPKLLEMQREIEEGNKACEKVCAHYALCGGGDPSNKLAEYGTFVATETVQCRLSRKVMTDLVVDKLEAEIGYGPTRQRAQPSL